MNVNIREITAIPTLMHWRREVIESVFGTEPSKRLLVAHRQYYRRHIADGTHFAIVASIDDTDAGCGALCLTEELPSPDNPSGRCAYLMNIYVRGGFRNRGIAHTIVRYLIDKARHLGCDKIYLETTDMTQPKLKSIGLDDLPDIMKYADNHSANIEIKP